MEWSDLVERGAAADDQLRTGGGLDGVGQLSDHPALPDARLADDCGDPAPSRPGHFEKVSDPVVLVVSSNHRAVEAGDASSARVRRGHAGDLIHLDRFRLAFDLHGRQERGLHVC